MRVLTRDDVRQVIGVESVIEAVQNAHAALARGEARQTVEAATPLPGGSGIMLPMAAAIGPAPAGFPGSGRAPTSGVAGVKLLADVPENPARGLHPQHSVITLLDPETGRCLALLDGIEITLRRTAAATAVATRWLARPDARTLGLIGAGAQAGSHLAALRAVREFERVAIWSRTRATAERFAAEHADCGIPIAILDDPEAVVRAADVVCTLTPSREPIVRGAWFRPGQHINAVGAPPRPDHREIDTDGLRRSLVVVDDLGAALHRSGDICVPIAEGAMTAADIHAELGQVILGERPGRTREDEITLFNSIGLALQDMATARIVVDDAIAAGVGVDIGVGV